MASLALKRLRQFFLLFCGLIENPKYKYLERAYSIIYTIIFLFEAFGNYVGYHAQELIVEQRVEMIVRLIGHGYCVSMFWMLRMNRDSVLKITADMCKSYPPHIGNEVLTITEKNFTQKGKGYLAIYSLGMMTYMSMSFFIAIFTRMKASDVYIYVFPYWYTCVDRDYKYKFLCWDVTGYASYMFKNGTQFGLMFIEQLNLLDSISLCLLITTNFQAHLQVIENRIKVVSGEIVNLACIQSQVKEYERKCQVNGARKEDGKLVVMKEAITQSEEKVRKQIIDFIRHHQFLYRTITEIKPVLTSIISLLLVFVWSLMLFVLCVIFVEENGSLIHRVKVGSLVIMTILVFYLTCYLGELMGRLNKSALEWFYEIPWFIMPVKLRKLMIIQQILLQNRYQLKAFGMILVNMERFGYSMRAMYTVLNMLLLSLRKH